MSKNFLSASFLLDGPQRGKMLSIEEVNDWKPENGTIWIHLDGNHEQTKEWLINNNIPSYAVEALLIDTTRPRFVEDHHHILLILRGVNFNPNSQPEDMISIRMWAEEKKIISITRNHLLSVNKISECLSNQKGPKTAGDFLITLLGFISAHISPLVDDIDEITEELERKVNENENRQLFSELADLRIKTILLHSYLSPQKEIIVNLIQSKIPWLNCKFNRGAKEHLEKISRFLEDLKIIKERILVTNEELRNTLLFKSNKSMYLFSLVAVLFLPLTFITGLFGINVGGIPGSLHPWAFWVFCGIMLGLATLLITFFKWRRWI